MFVAASQFFLLLPLPTHAALSENVMEQVKIGGEKAGMTEKNKAAESPQKFIAEIVQILLGTVGIVFIVLIFFGGYELVTAHGSEEKAKKALGIIQPAVIGLLIILMAYGITTFVASRFKQTVIEGVEISQ